MSDNNLRRLSRKDLLEILIDQEKEIESLKETNEMLSRQLKERNLKINDSGSMAEASMKLNDIFKSADEAAMLYLENIRQRETDACKRYFEIVSYARRIAKNLIDKAENAVYDEISPEELDHIRNEIDNLAEYPEFEEFENAHDEFKEE